MDKEELLLSTFAGTVRERKENALILVACLIEKDEGDSYFRNELGNQRNFLWKYDSHKIFDYISYAEVGENYIWLDQSGQRKLFCLLNMHMHPDTRKQTLEKLSL